MPKRAEEVEGLDEDLLLGVVRAVELLLEFHRQFGEGDFWFGEPACDKVLYLF